MRFRYLQRILQAYVGGGTSQLSFWHEVPMVNPAAFKKGSRQFYMTFHHKARYAGPFDKGGVPVLDYRGSLGRQHNPIAIAQYGLGCFNLFQDGAGAEWKERFLSIADWMAANLEKNVGGLPVWMHHFDWDYFRTLKAPWYSGLAQGQGIALLVRASHESSVGVPEKNTGAEKSGGGKHREAAEKAFESLVRPVDEGGTLFVDPQGDWWIEEYITEPPTHILNGFLWALWGVWDYWQLTGDKRAQELWQRSLITLEKHLHRFDTGYWSLYDLSPTRLRNVASPFYHSLHLVQLEIMYRLSGKEFFRETCERWRSYQSSFFRRKRAWVEKAVFKVLYF